MLDDKTATRRATSSVDTVDVVTARRSHGQRRVVRHRRHGGHAGATARRLRHRRRRRSCCTAATDLHRDLGEPPTPAPARTSCATAVPPRCPRHRGRHRRRGRTSSASDIQEALGFVTTFLLVFAGIALLVGVVPHRQHVLDARRPAHPGAGADAGARCHRRQVARSVLLRGRRRRARRARPSASALGVGIAIGLRRSSGAFGLDLSGQALVIEPRTVVVSLVVGVARHLVGGLPAGAPGRQGAAGRGDARRRRPRRERRCAGASSSGAYCSPSGCGRCRRRPARRRARADLLGRGGVLGVSSAWRCSVPLWAGR